MTPFTTEQMFRHSNQCDGANMPAGCHAGSRSLASLPLMLPMRSGEIPLKGGVCGKSYLISGMWSHQGHLVIASPEQSPNRIQLPLENPEN